MLGGGFFQDPLLEEEEGPPQSSSLPRDDRRQQLLRQQLYNKKKKHQRDQQKKKTKSRVAYWKRGSRRDFSEDGLFLDDHVEDDHDTDEGDDHNTGSFRRRRNQDGSKRSTVYGQIFARSRSSSSSTRSLSGGSTRNLYGGDGVSSPGRRASMLQFNNNSSSSSNKHSFLYTMLNPRSRKWPAVCFKSFISLVILVDLVFFVVSTEPQYADSHVFYYAEGATSSIFLLEYLCRLITVVESKRYTKDSNPWMARLRFMCTAGSIVDAMATFPFFLQLLTGWDLPTLTYLRVFRLLRILKTEGYADAMNSVVRVIYFNSEILYVAMCMCIFMVLVTAIFMYYLRPASMNNADNNNNNNDDGAGADDQYHDDFRSIASTMYVATLMLTGQGGPDNTNLLPWYTKIVVLLTSAFSVAMFAIPASMLTWGFEAEAERKAAQARRRRKRTMARKEQKLRRQQRQEQLQQQTAISTATATAEILSCSSGSSEDDWWSDGSENSSDEEYQKIISGEGIDEVGSSDQHENEHEKAAREEARKLKIQEGLMKLFESADGNKSGTLDWDEFVSYITKSPQVLESLRELTQESHGVAKAPVASEPGLTMERTGSGVSSGSVNVEQRLGQLEQSVTAINRKLDELLDAISRPTGK